MKLMLLLTLICCLSLASAAFLTSRQEGKRRLKRRIDALLTSAGAGAGASSSAAASGFGAGNEARAGKAASASAALRPVWETLYRAADARMSPRVARTLERKLQEAGEPFGLRPADVRLLQALFGASFALVVFLICAPLSGPFGQTALFALGAGVYGYAYPTFYLNAKRKRRIALIEKAMPDFFDMVNVSVEAGLGLDAATLKVSKKLSGPLSDEMGRALEEMKLGKTRRDAFGSVRDRVPSELLRSLINALVQADQMGIGMSKVLRAQTVRIRELHKQRAKETAMKAPVKMLFPMILFIFPVLFLILLGPIVVQFVTEWM